MADGNIKKMSHSTSATIIQIILTLIGFGVPMHWYLIRLLFILVASILLIHLFAKTPWKIGRLSRFWKTMLTGVTVFLLFSCYSYFTPNIKEVVMRLHTGFAACAIFVCSMAVIAFVYWYITGPMFKPTEIAQTGATDGKEKSEQVKKVDKEIPADRPKTTGIRVTGKDNIIRNNDVRGADVGYDIEGERNVTEKNKYTPPNNNLK